MIRRSRTEALAPKKQRRAGIRRLWGGILTRGVAECLWGECNGPGKNREASGCAAPERGHDAGGAGRVQRRNIQDRFVLRNRALSAGYWGACAAGKGVWHNRGRAAGGRKRRRKHARRAEAGRVLSQGAYRADGSRLDGGRRAGCGGACPAQAVPNRRRNADRAGGAYVFAQQDDGVCEGEALLLKTRREKAGACDGVCFRPKVPAVFIVRSLRSGAAFVVADTAHAVAGEAGFVFSAVLVTA